MKAHLAAIALGLLFSAVPSTAAGEKRPNFLFLLVDDQRNDTLGCAGHPHIRTPHIDQLAAQGVRFSNAFVTTPICMASRASILTGMTETGHGYTGGGPPAIPLVKEDIDTAFPTLLRDAGYRTGFYGKLHLKFTEGQGPALDRLYDDHRLYQGGPHFVPVPDGSKRHCDDRVGDHSVDFLRAQPADRPFCLYLSFNISHARDDDHRPGSGHYPWPTSADGLYEDIEPPPPRLGDPAILAALPAFMRDSMNRDRWFWRWDTPEKYRINMRAYYRMVTGMDAVVGRVLAELESRGLAGNTVVIYTADNGLFMGNRGLADKWLHYEESLRVPLIVHDPRPGKTKPGIVHPAMALNIDLAPTLLDLAGVAIPAKYQGRSLKPLLKGETPPDWREEFFCEHHSTNPRIPEWLGIRGKRYSYARYVKPGPVFEMLHDFEKDPDQLVNLATDPAHAGLLRQFREKTDAYEKRYRRPEIDRLRAEAVAKDKKGR